MRDLLNDEIKNEFGVMPDLVIGSTEWKETAAGLTKFIDKEIELIKIDAERQDKLEQQKRQEELQREKDELDRIEKQNQLDLQREQLKMQQKQLDLQAKQNKRSTVTTLLQIGVTLGIAAAGLAIQVWGSNKAWDKEDDGYIITSGPGREYQKKLFDKR